MRAARYGDECAHVQLLPPRVRNSPLSPSLQRIKELNPAAPSGEYDIRPIGFTSSTKLTVFCEMTVSGGGWTRVGFIDETLNGQNSPCVEESVNYINLRDLRHRSFAAVWYANQRPQEMIIHSIVSVVRPWL